MNTEQFNKELEELVSKAEDSGMSDAKIATLLTQEVTVKASQNMPEDNWKAIQQSSMAMRSLLE